jgi:hypothetical protein
MDEEYPDQGEGQKIYAERELVSLPLTGDDRVDAAVAALSRLPGTPADEHVAVLEEVHGQLRDILGELNDDSGQGQP